MTFLETPNNSTLVTLSENTSSELERNHPNLNQNNIEFNILSISSSSPTIEIVDIDSSSVVRDQNSINIMVKRVPSDNISSLDPLSPTSPPISNSEDLPLQLSNINVDIPCDVLETDSDGNLTIPTTLKEVSLTNIYDDPISTTRNQSELTNKTSIIHTQIQNPAQVDLPLRSTDLPPKPQIEHRDLATWGETYISVLHSVELPLFIPPGGKIIAVPLDTRLVFDPSQPSKVPNNVENPPKYSDQNFQTVKSSSIESSENMADIESVVLQDSSNASVFFNSLLDQERYSTDNSLSTSDSSPSFDLVEFSDTHSSKILFLHISSIVFVLLGIISFFFGVVTLSLFYFFYAIVCIFYTKSIDHRGMKSLSRSFAIGCALLLIYCYTTWFKYYNTQLDYYSRLYVSIMCILSIIFFGACSFVSFRLGKALLEVMEHYLHSVYGLSRNPTPHPQSSIS